MRILIITQYFPPEYNAGALRTHHHCRRWVERGARVKVITSTPNFPLGKPFPPYGNPLWHREKIDGIDVIRVWSLLAENNGIIWRSISFLSFAVTSFIAGLFFSADIIVATSPQLLAGLTGWWLSAVKGRPWILEVRDLWPDTILAINRMRANLFVRGLKRLELQLYKKTTKVVTVTRGLQSIIAARLGSPDKVSLIYNAADTRSFTQSPPPQDSATFRLDYVGTLGFTQGLDIILDAADALKEQPIKFYLTGAGGYRKGLAEKIAAKGLQNIELLPAIAPHAVPQRIAQGDASLITLRNDPLFLTAIPSKLFSAAAIGRPIIGSMGGEAADLIREYNAGLVSPPGDVAGLVQAILLMRNDTKLRNAMREGALALAQEFQRDQMADKMFAIMEDIVSRVTKK